MSNKRSIEIYFEPLQAKKYLELLNITAESEVYNIPLQGEGESEVIILRDVISPVNDYVAFTNDDDIQSLYIDFDALFNTNPNTGDIVKKRDEDSVMQSIKNILLSSKLWNNTNIDVYGLIFEDIGAPFREDLIIDTMEEVIRDYEPRIGVLKISIDYDTYDMKTANINIEFSLKNNIKALYKKRLLIENK